MASCADFQSYRLYETSETGSPRIVKLMTLSQGESLTRRGKAERGVDRDGKTPCFLKVKVVVAMKPVVAVGSEAETEERSNTAFTIPEVEAIAGLRGRSRTARMSEEQRATRVDSRTGNRLPAVDLVEKATNKLKAWNQIGSLMSEVKVVESACLS